MENSSTANTTERFAKAKQHLISAFIILNLLSIAVFGITSGDARQNLIRLFGIYYYMSGLYQEFHTFSPDVSKSSNFVFAMVKMDDGSTIRWQFPVLSKMDFVRRTFKHRYYKLTEDLLRPQNHALLANSAAYVARDCYEKYGRKRKPVSVTFFVDWRWPPPPEDLDKPARSGAEKVGGPFPVKMEDRP